MVNRFSAIALAAATVAALLGAAPAHGATPPPAASSATTVKVDGSSPGRTFDGVGALSAGATSRLLIDYPPRERSQILDYLFKPGYGAALQNLKVEIGGDTNSTDGTEPSHMHTSTDLSCSRGYEWWLMEQAKKRNPNIELSALGWGAPGWVGQGKQTLWTQSYITYLLSWLGCANQHHLRINYLGGWNERGYDENWYIALRKALDTHGYGYIKIVADDSFNWNVDKAIASNPAFAKAVDVIGQHYVCGYLSAYNSCPSPQQAQGFDKPLWASEQGSQPANSGAAPLARAINRQYVDGRMTGTINWSLEWSAYQGLPYEGSGLLNANEPWSGHYSLGATTWAIAQTTQFTQPGWRYLNSGSERIPGGSVVSLRAPHGSAWSSVAETLNATAPQKLTFHVTGGLATSQVHVFATNPSSSDSHDWFIQQKSINIHNGTFTTTLPPGWVYSFTTTRGQHKGAAASPKATGWALPYDETFNEYTNDVTPKYFSDLGGTFATAPCGAGRGGRCLQQVVGTQPVQWNSLDNHPLTIVGDPANWHNYTAQVDAMMKQSGTFDLGGRVLNGTSGYHLKANTDGNWTLSKVAPSGSSTQLAAGKTPFAVGTWHHLTLEMQSLQITAKIDGKSLATVGDATYTTGQVSIGESGFQQFQLDNLSIKQAPGRASLLNIHNVTPSPLPLDAGKAHPLSATVTNPGPVGARDIDLSLQVPKGWNATPSSTHSALQRGQSRTWTWRVTAPAGTAPGKYAATLNLRYRSGKQIGNQTQPLPLTVDLVPQAGMTATATSNQDIYPPSNAIDGNPATFWHIEYSPTLAKLPQSITLNLGGNYTVSGLLYQPRINNHSGDRNGDITGYSVAVSADGKTFTEVKNGNWLDDPSAKSTTFTRTGPVRYVRLTALSGHGGFASAAEINVVGYPASTASTTVRLTDSHGQALAGGMVAYYAHGSWHTIGTTDSNGAVTAAIPPGRYSFAMTYQGTREQLNGQQVSGTGTSTVAFQTELVNVELQGSDSNGHVGKILGIPGNGSASYYADGKDRKVTTRNPNNPNIVQAQMLPGTYTFAVTYNGTWAQKKFTIATPAASSTTQTVYFHAALVNVELQGSDSNGHVGKVLGIPGNGSASYYAAGRYHKVATVDVNNPNIVQAQMLPGTYTFAATYNGTWAQKKFTITEPNANGGPANNHADQSVYFHAALVFVQTKATVNGKTTIVAGSASYYANGAYHPITTPDANNPKMVQAQMLPGTYSFTDTYHKTGQLAKHTIIEPNANNGAHADQIVYFGFRS